MRVPKIAVKRIMIVIFGFVVLIIPACYDIVKLKWYMNSPIPFDQTKWISAASNSSRNSEDAYIRLQMAAFIIDREMISGLDIVDVENLLGKPQYHRAIPGSAYWLSPFGLDSSWLQVMYKDNRVQTYRVVTD